MMLRHPGTQAKGCTYWIQRVGQGLGPDSQNLVFTSLTRFSSLSSFAISTAGPFCTSWPFFSWGEGSDHGDGEGPAASSKVPPWLLCPACPSYSRTLPCSWHSVLPLLRLGDSEPHWRAWEEYSNSSSEAQPGLRAGRSGKRHFYPQFLRSQPGKAIGSGESFSLGPPRLSPAKRR